MQNVYDFEAEAINGHTMRLDAYRGNVLLIVNVASQCGFTPQYAGLEALYRKYCERGFMVLGFPCDQFGRQEPGDEAEIRDFCRLTYDVTFPLFAKIAVNGAAAHPVYVYLKAARRGFLGTKGIKWNFTKFMVGRDGKVVRRFGPMVKTGRIEKDLLRILRE